MVGSILLVESDDVARTSLSIHLESSPLDIPVVACADVFAAAQAIHADVPFDAAIVELDVRGGQGIDVIHGLRRHRPSCPCVVYTSRADDEALFGALRAGAKGFLAKPEPPARLHAAILEALAGGAPMSPVIARRVVESFLVPSAPPCELTPREREVLTLLARGHTYTDVAAALNLGVGTIQGYIKTLYRKIEVSSKAEAAAYASRLGIA